MEHTRSATCRTGLVYLIILFVWFIWLVGQRVGRGQFFWFVGFCFLSLLELDETRQTNKPGKLAQLRMMVNERGSGVRVGPVRLNILPVDGFRGFF